MITSEAALAKLAEAESSGEVSSTASRNIARWLQEPPFEEYRGRLLEDIEKGRWKELDLAFYAVLEFGTGGRRGKMYPVGINVLNDRTIAESARGLADYVTAQKGDRSPRSCVIAHDTRHRSAEFARLCGRVLAAANFKVYLVKEPRSTPLLSCAVRHLGCDAGIMITASHNPPSDNGFKCYARSGGQVVPPDDQGIIACVEAASDRQIPEMPLEQALKSGAVVEVLDELDFAYITAVLSESVSHARELSIVYTPLHGVGASSVARVARVRRGSQRSPPSRRRAARTLIFPMSPTMWPTRNIPARSRQRLPRQKRSGAPGSRQRSGC